jgi:DNA helicase HerA-like ATPase
MADVKGDLTGISQAGKIGAKLAEVLKERGLAQPAPQACPTTLWDVFGESGHPVRATVSDMGPLLLARMLNLNETQTGVLNLVFKIADDNGLMLLDLKDLRAMLQYVGDNGSEFTTTYGNISAASVVPFSVDCFRSNNRAVTSSLVSPCSTSATSCRPLTGKASSMCWRLTSS